MIDAVAALSVGLVRTLNEDGVFVGDRVVVVADGMGGHAAGDLARDIVLAALAAVDHEGATAVDVRSAVGAANATILEHANTHPEQAGLGTTVCGALLIEADEGARWLVFNVGDSRAYLWHEAQLLRITRDHSEVQELVDAGVLTDTQARTAPNRNVITRAVGQLPPPVVDFFTVPAGRGELLLLSSDGLTSELDDDEIRRIVAGQGDRSRLAGDLVAAAEAAGGQDNISVIVACVSGGAVELVAQDVEDLGGRSRSTTVPRDLVAREVIT